MHGRLISTAKEHPSGPADRRTIAFIPEIVRNKNARFPEITWRITLRFEFSRVVLALSGLRSAGFSASVLGCDSVRCIGRPVCSEKSRFTPPITKKLPGDIPQKVKEALPHQEDFPVFPP